MVHEEATGGTILGEVVNYVKPLWNIATGEHSHWIRSWGTLILTAKNPRGAGAG